MKEKRDITKPYFIDRRESADATLVIHRELPTGFIAGEKDEVGRTLRLDDEAVGPEGKIMHLCKECGGWLEGEKLSYIHSTGHRDLSGHTVSRSYCRKKAHLISSCSFMS